MDFTTGEAAISVDAKGTAPVSVTVEWFNSNQSGVLGTADGRAETLTYQPGSGAVVRRHVFSGQGCYWGVRVTTKPAAGNGSQTDQVWLTRCMIR
ncbi:hypothetical protein ACWGQT_04020 [Streptomyces yangpuensis]